MKNNYLDLIQACDRLPPSASTSHLYRFHIHPFPQTYTFGYLLPSTITYLTTTCPHLLFPPFFTLSHKSQTLTLLPTTPALRSQTLYKFLLTLKEKGLFPRILDGLDTSCERIPIFGPKGWGGAFHGRERVVGNAMPTNVAADRERDVIATLPAQARPILGVLGYGVQLICYERACQTPPSPVSPTSPMPTNLPMAPHATTPPSPASKPGLKMPIEAIYIGRRSASKRTFPRMLDSTVGGTIRAGEAPFECLLREAMEEASIPAHVIRSKARNCGTLKYITYTGEMEAADREGRDSVDGFDHSERGGPSGEGGIECKAERRERRKFHELVDPEGRFLFEMEMDGDGDSGPVLGKGLGKGEEGLLRPAVQFLWEMEVQHVGNGKGGGAGWVLEPGDGEVDGFRRMTIVEVQEALHREEFPPAIGMVLIDALVRWGVINAQNEKDFAEICRRLKRGLEFPTM